MSDASAEAEPSPAPVTAEGRRRGLSVRVLLLFVAAVPVVGMLALLVTSARDLDAERRAAARLDRDAMELVELIDARTAVSAEEVASSVLVIGARLGVDAGDLEEMFDQDFAAQLEAARDVVDANAALHEIEAIAPAVESFLALRPGIDAGTVSAVELDEAIGRLTDAIDQVWGASVLRQIELADDEDLGSSAQLRLLALGSAYVVLSTASDRALITEAVLNGDPTPEQLRRLVDATGAYEQATEILPGRLGPVGRAAWEEHLQRPASQRFEAVLDQVVEALVAGEEPPLRGDPVAFGEAFIDGTAWGVGLRETVQGAAQDLRDDASARADAADRDLQRQILLAVALVLVSVLVALRAGSTVVRPVRRLEGAAHRVQEGRFSASTVEERGPRELADTARAFNEMTSTLVAVEAHAVALADDLDAPILAEPLPGRTGRALQVALNRLRASMQVAEQRRRDLEKAATHDSLTGLMNRAAAFEVLGRDLLRAERGGGLVVALYVDLDGLKPVNDQYGHAAGDDALRLTATALRDASRASDVVARLGGDEFLVAGVLPEGRSSAAEAEAEAFATRVLDHVRAQSVAVSVSDAPIPLRCSIGIAVAGPGTTVEALVNEADAALIEAKRTGKDRVGWWSGRSEGVPRT